MVVRGGGDGHEYFEQVLNVADVREANINVVGNWQIPVLLDLYERAINIVRRSKGGSEWN